MLWKGFLGSLVAVPGVALAVLLLWWVLEVRDRVGPWPAVGLVLVVLAGWVLGVIGLASSMFWFDALPVSYFAFIYS